MTCTLHYNMTIKDVILSTTELLFYVLLGPIYKNHINTDKGEDNKKALVCL